jgi:apolipoprotein N-acyltransferase
MFQIDGTGQLRGRYDKEYLVPFFEYFPFAGLDLMSRGFEGARTFERGDRRPAPLETRLGRVGMLVCVEAMFPEAARDRVRAGAEVLLSPSNDAWIADGDFAEHMLGVVGMRAIEQRRYLVRASTSGPSAVIDPWGRVLVETDPFRRHLLVGRVEPREQQSLYGRLGDTFAYACITAALLATASSLRGAWPRRSDV